MVDPGDFGSRVGFTPINNNDPEMDLFPAIAFGPIRLEDESDVDFVSRIRKHLDDQAQIERDTNLAESIAEESQDDDDFDRLFDSDTAAGYEGQGSD